MPFLDPGALARSQLGRDRKQLAHFPKLLPHKIDRMRASPLAFLRGAAPLYYELLQTHPELLPELPGRGWIAGDLHLENFGAFRPDGFGEDPQKARVVYGPNDFDDAIVGPWVCDALRLATSVLLGARSWCGGPDALGLAELTLAAHAGGVGGRALPEEPKLVRKLVEEVRERKRVELLDRFTERAHGGRRLRRGDHFHDLPKDLASDARKAFETYVAGLAEKDRPEADALEIVDLAFRVAGTGSLGMLRIALLVAGKGGADGGWLFDMKEQGAPSPAALLGNPDQPPAERVLAALRACLEHPPHLAGTTTLGHRSMFVRRLAPQEDRVDPSTASKDDLEDLVGYLGALAGAMHRRGAVDRAEPWTEAQRGKILDAAIALAGVHEAVYLAFLRETRGSA